ncbi:MAG: hypothetical protein Q8Q94_00280 [bacterium]|nr:hypothetical protein [bacterium]
MKSPEMGGSTPEQPSEQEKPKSRIFVGAKRNPDGTMDYSKAMTMDDPEGKIARGFEKAEQDRKLERSKKLEIPADVKAGTSSMVWYNLRNAIFVNEETIEKAKRENKPTDSRKMELIEKLKMERSMLDDHNLSLIVEKKITQDAQSRGEKLTDEQVRERMRGFPASEMISFIQEYFIDRYEEFKDKGAERGFLGRQDYPMEELLKVAKELQSRLVDESARSGSQ